MTTIFRILIIFFALTTSVASEDRTNHIGFGFILNNDFFGDGQDRWQTGSLSTSRLYGRLPLGQLPTAFGELVEIRLHDQIISPNDTTSATPDRQWAGLYSLGVHSHFRDDVLRYSLGMDLNVLGPQTGLFDFQKNLHNMIGNKPFNEAVKDTAIRDQIRISAQSEVAYPFELGTQASGRASGAIFAEVRTGLEDIARIGFDLSIGNDHFAAIKLRDTVTGQLYTVVPEGKPSLAFTFGADTAKVGRSVFFPDPTIATALPNRHRVRAGLNWSAGRAFGFFGLTWLSPEFEGQKSGQIVGSWQTQIKF